MDPAIPLVIVLSFALLWFVAALQKLRVFAVFVTVLSDCRLVPQGATRA